MATAEERAAAASARIAAKEGKAITIRLKGGTTDHAFAKALVFNNVTNKQFDDGGHGDQDVTTPAFRLLESEALTTLGRLPAPEDVVTFEGKTFSVVGLDRFGGAVTVRCESSKNTFRRAQSGTRT
jgi:hypothetical protein